MHDRTAERDSSAGSPRRSQPPAVVPASFAGLALGLQRAIGNAAFARAVAPPRATAARRSLQRVTYTPGVMHDHRPSGRWADVQATPNSGWAEELVCSNMSPSGVIGAAIWKEFDDKPLALDHLNWYLSTGGGRDYVEDANLATLLRTDRGIQRLLAGLLPAAAPAGGKFASWTKIEQFDYTSQDFRFAFGAIDRLDFEADYGAGTLQAWFQDRYEWHPVYPFYTALPGDAARSTNCIHAALVEVKAGGVAADYWMKGEATVPLSVIRPASGSGSGGSAL